MIRHVEHRRTAEDYVDKYISQMHDRLETRGCFFYDEFAPIVNSAARYIADVLNDREGNEPESDEYLIATEENLPGKGWYGVICRASNYDRKFLIQELMKYYS